MKAIKITYWATTAIVALMMCFSAYMYVSAPAMTTAFHHLGFPDYFRIELAIAKVIGAVVLLAPVALRVKEWAYAGFTISFLGAFWSRLAMGDAIGLAIAPVIMLAVMFVSYFLWKKFENLKRA